MHPYMSSENSDLSFEDISSYSRWFEPLIKAEQIETCCEQNAKIHWTKPADQEKDLWLANYIPDSYKRIDRSKKGDKFTLEIISEDKADRCHHLSLTANVKYGYQQIAGTTYNNTLSLILEIPNCYNDKLSELFKNSNFVRNRDFRAYDYNITVVDTSKDTPTAIQLEAIGRLEHFDFYVSERKNQDLFKLILGGVNFDIDNQLTPFEGQYENISSDCESEKIREGTNALNNLNESQRTAVKKALSQRVTLIDGPPGTGKTETAAAIVYQLHCLIRSKDDTNAGRQRAKEADSDEDPWPSSGSEAVEGSTREKTTEIIPELRIATGVYGPRGKLLVCAQSNVAVDNIAERLDEAGLNVVRVRSTEQQGIGPNPQLSLDVKIAKSEGYYCGKLRRVKEMIESGARAACYRLYLADRSGRMAKRPRRMAEESLTDELDEDEDFDRKLRELTHDCECEVLSRADVVCCTLIGSAKLWSNHLSRIQYDTLLIDECCQATETECLVPITLWPRRLVLIGDERQLGPQVNINSEVTTLFTRLKKRKHNQLESQQLNLQYRMHPSISSFPFRHFYEGKVTDGIDGSQRTWKYGAEENPFLNPNEPFQFHCCSHPEQFFSKSRRNVGEADIVKSIVLKLLKAKITPDKIGVITPYSAQQDGLRRVLESAIREYRYYRTSYLHIATVDGFQGKEKDFIIMSCVRSNEEGVIGFLKDARRLNVALTRAKYGLIIVGNAKTLNNDPLWSELLADIDSRNLLVESDSPSKDSPYKVRVTTLRRQLRALWIGEDYQTDQKCLR